MALIQRNLSAVALACLGWLCAPTAAQPAPEPAQFRVVCLAESASFFHDLAGVKTRIDAGIDSFSNLIPAPPDRDIVLYAEVPAATPGRPPAKKPLARARLPGAGSGPFLLVLHPAPPGSELKFGTLVIDQSLDAHPSQSYRVFNFSRRRVAVNLAGRDLLLAPRESGLVPYPGDRKTWLKIAVNNHADGWQLVRSSSHPVGPGTRTSILILDIPPTPDVPDPVGVVTRRIRETIATDEAGAQHVR